MMGRVVASNHSFQLSSYYRHHGKWGPLILFNILSHVHIQPFMFSLQIPVGPSTITATVQEFSPFDGSGSLFTTFYDPNAIFQCLFKSKNVPDSRFWGLYSADSPPPFSGKELSHRIQSAKISMIIQ